MTEDVKALAEAIRAAASLLNVALDRAAQHGIETQIRTLEITNIGHSARCMTVVVEPRILL